MWSLATRCTRLHKDCRNFVFCTEGEHAQCNSLGSHESRSTRRRETNSQNFCELDVVFHSNGHGLHFDRDLTRGIKNCVQAWALNPCTWAARATSLPPANKSAKKRPDGFHRRARSFPLRGDCFPHQHQFLSCSMHRMSQTQHEAVFRILLIMFGLLEAVFRSLLRFDCCVRTCACFLPATKPLFSEQHPTFDIVELCLRWRLSDEVDRG